MRTPYMKIITVLMLFLLILSLSACTPKVQILSAKNTLNTLNPVELTEDQEAVLAYVNPCKLYIFDYDVDESIQTLVTTKKIYTNGQWTEQTLSGQTMEFSRVGQIAIAVDETNRVRVTTKGDGHMGSSEFKLHEYPDLDDFTRIDGALDVSQTITPDEPILLCHKIYTTSLGFEVSAMTSYGKQLEEFEQYDYAVLFYCTFSTEPLANPINE